MQIKPTLRFLSHPRQNGHHEGQQMVVNMLSKGNSYPLLVGVQTSAAIMEVSMEISKEIHK